MVFYEASLLFVHACVKQWNSIYMYMYIVIKYSGTPYKGHLWIKDTSLQGTLFLSHFDTLLC